MYVSNLEDNSWQKLDVSEEDMNKFKIILNDSIEIYEVLKDNLDKISIKEDGGKLYYFCC